MISSYVMSLLPRFNVYDSQRFVVAAGCLSLLFGCKTPDAKKEIRARAPASPRYASASPRYAPSSPRSDAAISGGGGVAGLPAASDLKGGQSFASLNEKGIEFVRKNQQTDGAFLVEEINNGTGITLRRTPYVTAFILSLLDDPQVIDAGARYLKSTSEGGFWRFYPQNPMPPLDIDDTSVSWTALRKKGMAMPEAVRRRIMGNFRNGGFGTWLTEDPGELTSCVTANVLHVLSPERKNETILRQICDFLVSTMNKEGWWNCQWYFISPYASSYMVSRNHDVLNRGCLEQIEPSMLAMLKKRQKSDGGWGRNETSNSLDTALAILSIRNLQGDVSQIDRGRRYLADRVGLDGGWESVPFFTQGPKSRQIQYGSRELTTAFALAALRDSNSQSGRRP